MIKVKARLYGTLRRLSKVDTPGLWEGEIPPHTKIEEFIYLLGTTPSEVSNVAMNGKICPLETEIVNGAELVLVTPVGGG